MSRANESASPITRDEYPGFGLEKRMVSRGGLTIREHFAGLAMQGIYANAIATSGGASAETIAMWACQQADALIAELAKVTP